MKKIAILLAIGSICINNIVSVGACEINREPIVQSIRQSLPDKHKELLDEYTIVFTDSEDDIASIMKAPTVVENVRGMVSLKQKKIAIVDDGDSMYNPLHSLYHEFGHVLDKYEGYKFGKYSDTEEFRGLANKHGNKLVEKSTDARYMENYIETFADLYAIYKIEPEFMNENASEIYEYFKGIDDNAN